VNLPDSVDEVDAAMLKNKMKGKEAREYEAVVSNLLAASAGYVMQPSFDW
jgi:hypothetical protein